MKSAPLEALKAPSRHAVSTNQDAGQRGIQKFSHGYTVPRQCRVAHTDVVWWTQLEEQRKYVSTIW
jgi:GTP cyclohydrolase III